MLGSFVDSEYCFKGVIVGCPPARFLRAHQVDLIDALQEVAMQEPETPWMFDDYRYILDNADRIKKVWENEYSSTLRPACSGLSEHKVIASLRLLFHALFVATVLRIRETATLCVL